MSVKDVVKDFLTNTKEAVKPKPMKVGDKIRAVLKQFPDIQRRRAQINAIGYLSKEAQPGDVEWHIHHSQTDTCLVYYPRNENGHRCDMTIIHMPALSVYNITLSGV